VGQENDREVSFSLLDFHAEGKGVHIVDMGCGDHQVEFLFVQVLQRRIG